MNRSPIDFSKQVRRSRFEAWLLDKADQQIHARYGDKKAAIIGGMGPTVVEIGPGTGVNMKYYAPGTRVIALEPNPNMHPSLRAAAEANNVDIDIREERAESISIGDGEADGVVGTLVLCGVDDPRAVVTEIKRVLRPGGTYFFAEHVVAPAATMTRRVQRVVKGPHRWLANGCEVDRDTATLLRNSGFGELSLQEVDSGMRGLYLRHQIFGTAKR